MKIKFEEFQSLLNENPKNSMKSLRENADEECVVTEKIHGANFSVYISGEGVQCASRSQMFGRDYNFFQYNRFFTDERIEGLVDAYKASYFTNPIRLIGELFGGHDAPGIKPVQKEIRYDGDIQFRMFHAQFFTEDGQVADCPWYMVEAMAKMFGFELAPVVAVGKLSEVYPMDTEVPSQLCSKGDIAEGFCFRVETGGFKPPVIFKRRSKNFCETKGTLKSPKAQEAMDPAILEQLNAAMSFVTPQRVSNVNSHFGYSEMRNIPDLMFAVMADLEKDTAADLGMEPHIWKLIKKTIGREVLPLVKQEVSK